MPSTNVKALRLKRDAYVVLNRTTGSAKVTVTNFFPIPYSVLEADVGNYGKIKIWGWGSGSIYSAIKHAKRIALYNALKLVTGADVVIQPHYRVRVIEGLTTVIKVSVTGKAISIKTDEEYHSSGSNVSKAETPKTRKARKPEKPSPTQEEISMGLTKKCKNMNYVACAKLAFRYQRGVGVKQDNATALTLFRKACDGGLKKACEYYNKLANPY
jgi:hypothetical protein